MNDQPKNKPPEQPRSSAALMLELKTRLDEVFEARDLFALLSAEFPRHLVSWRAQSLTSDNKKAQALAYIDARDVMRRLDQVFGPDNWSDSYHETPTGRVLCTLSLRINNDWISKTDGAGATDMEGEKGGISDAFKRAAVKWGIGRYLYDLPVPWVPCETYPKDGKHRFSKFTQDPWDVIYPNKKPAQAKSSSDIPPTPISPTIKKADDLLDAFMAANNAITLQKLWDDNKSHIAAISASDPVKYDELFFAKESRMADFAKPTVDSAIAGKAA